VLTTNNAISFTEYISSLELRRLVKKQLTPVQFAPNLSYFFVIFSIKILVLLPLLDTAELYQQSVNNDFLRWVSADA
jgi:hypothetical protein